MAAGDPAPDSVGGGAVIQAPRPARARLSTALAALLALAGTVAFAGLTAAHLRPVSLAVGAVAVSLLALGLVLRWPSTVPWAVLAAAAAYVLGRAEGDVVDGWAAVAGVALLVAAELAFWSIEHDARIRTEPALTRRRIATLAGLALLALVVDFLLLGTAGAAASTGLLLAAVGVAAAVAAITVVLRLVRA